ncbi:MAG: 30S ribosomal protein S12 methylthiotransferase RimO [Eubacteriaceae bacterium]|jgi:ribosomal protein S12 methylthiotransferase|nr:30S ribosomal protein S12 methylthiotransferase RimO [Eubacteriaceae bacterium]
MRGTFYIHSLGCDKNTVDSEKLAFALREAGFSPIDGPEGADYILVNTCGFIDSAKEESVEALFEAARFKSAGAKAVIALGCLAQRYAKELEAGIEGLDLVCGKGSIDAILAFLLEGAPAAEWSEEGRIVSTPPYTAYLKISEGCNKVCSFCAIPKIVGNLKSRSMDSLFKEAEILAGNGVRELVLVAQDTGDYGSDLSDGSSLPKLLRRLECIEGIHWIRLMYMYPESISSELVELMKSSHKILPYLDIPFQHASDRILRAMARPQTKEGIKGQISMLRDEIPGIAIRSSFVCGFPGESRSDVDELKSFLCEARLDRVGVFCYSREEGTKAYGLPGHVPSKEKNRRYGELMQLQESLSQKNMEDRIGTYIEVLIEGEESPGVYAGRSYMDAPDVDGIVYVHTGEDLCAGDFLWAYVTGATAHDLIADAKKGLSNEPPQ